jgi:hypothetical protein
MRTLLSPNQLTVLEFCAEECHRLKSGALSVFTMMTAYSFLYHYRDSGSTQPQLTDELSQRHLSVVHGCAKACQRRQHGEMAVYWLTMAFEQVARFRGLDNIRPLLTADLVEELYKTVEPERNKNGFTSQSMLTSLQALLIEQETVLPRHFMERFVKLQLCTTGNSRVGWLLFNYLETSTFVLDR